MKKKSFKFNWYSLAVYPAPVRILIFAISLLGLWIPFAAILYGFGGDRNWASILALVILYLEFIGLVRFWGKQVYQQPQLLRQYGLTNSRKNAQTTLKGFIIGVTSLFVLFGLETSLGWRTWNTAQILQSLQTNPIYIVEGLAVAIGIGFAEELLFRGWLLDELHRDYSLSVAVRWSSLVFALLHFIKPLAEVRRTILQFPGLVLLGLALAWGKCSHRTPTTPRGQLGWSMGFHGGLVWAYYLINVGKWTKPSGVVPQWVTGVDQNPLAGIMGLICLSLIALWMYLIGKRMNDDQPN